ncbi:MAG: hypothetical protein KF746_09035 [Chitinophagaceae bacterium]|nr:hypothetical protein [Chitinophagaceae bacterium]
MKINNKLKVFFSFILFFSAYHSYSQNDFFLRNGSVYSKNNFLSKWGLPGEDLAIVSATDSVFVPINCEVIDFSRLDDSYGIKLKYLDYYIYLLNLDHLNIDKDALLRKRDYIGKAKYDTDFDCFLIFLSISKEGKYMSKDAVKIFLKKNI